MEREAHIYIYGIIDSMQDADANQYGYINLSSVKNQLDNQGDYDHLFVHIHSEGGVVTEGFAIHDFIRSQGKPVTTIIDGMCASIATVILLAGDTRIGTENAKPFIHNPWGMAGGDKEELRKYADELETIEEDIADFYAAKTNLTKEKALEYMRNETYFTAAEALSNGFLTELNSVMRAVALLKSKNKKMAKENLTEEKVQGMMDSILEKITNVLKGKAKPQNKIVTDATGIEILFPDVEDDAMEVVGDTATIDGSAAEGDILMPDGSTYVFTEGELTEIKEAEEDPEDDVEALKQKITDLEAENEALKTSNNTLEDEATQNKKDAKTLKEEVKGIKDSVKDMKKNIGSNFKHDPKKKNFKKDQEGSRSVFRKVEEK